MVKYISLKFCHKLSHEEIQSRCAFQWDGCTVTNVMATWRLNSFLTFFYYKYMSNICLKFGLDLLIGEIEDQFAVW
jgi:hypothetical protein